MVDMVPWIVLAVLGLILAIYDVAAWRGLTGTRTISRAIWDFSRRNWWAKWLYVVLTVFLYWHFFIQAR